MERQDIPKDNSNDNAIETSEEKIKTS